MTKYYGFSNSCAQCLLYIHHLSWMYVVRISSKIKDNPDSHWKHWVTYSKWLGDPLSGCCPVVKNGCFRRIFNSKTYRSVFYFTNLCCFIKIVFNVVYWHSEITLHNTLCSQWVTYLTQHQEYFLWHSC